MTTRASILTRLTVIVLSLFILASGLAILTWHFDVADVRDRLTGGPVPDITTWPEAGWWPWALGIATALSAIIALTSLFGLAARHGIGTWVLDGASTSGELSADVHAVASASAQSFARIDGVRRASHRVHEREGVPTMEITLRCSPQVALNRVEKAARINGAALATSFDKPQLAQRVFVRIEKAAREQ